jgi:hypothetical protein
MGKMKDAVIDLQNNYDNMSVDEWLQTFFEAAVCNGVAFAGNEEVTIDEIKSSLRKAFIREASIGEVTVKITEYEDEVTSPVGSPDRIVTCSEQFISQHWIPEGTYLLTKKETS